jgi:uncharacterized protein (TIGR02217 family)
MPWHVGVRAESPVFFSRLITDGAGLKQGFQPRVRGGRTPLPGMPLFSGDTGDLWLECEEEIEYALAWFNARRGKWGVFRHRNYMDFKCSNLPKSYCYDEELTAQGVTYPFLGDGANSRFELLKAYQSPIAPSTYREVWAVESGSFTPYVNGVAVPSGWVLDYDQGILRFNSPPPAGAAITHDCSFDLWVRFDFDAISLEVIEPNRIAKVASLPITEVGISRDLVEVYAEFLYNPAFTPLAYETAVTPIFQN